METNPGDDNHVEATEMLDALSVDRRRLVGQTQVPWTLMAAYGAVAAWWVGSAALTEPGAAYEPSGEWLVLLSVLLIAHLAQHETGIRFRSLGARAHWVLGAVMVLCLALFSISLGLVSLGLHWAVTVTSLTTFMITTWLTGIAYRYAVERLVRD